MNQEQTRTQEIKKDLQAFFPGVVFSVVRTDENILVTAGTPKKRISMDQRNAIIGYCHDESIFHGVSEENPVSKHLLDEINVTTWLV